MALSTLEQVRLLIGDTDSTDYTLTDVQVQHFLDEADDAVRTAAIEAANAAARALAIRATRETTGAMSVDLTARAQLYRQVALDLASGMGAIGPCYVGGISQAEIESGRDDSSLPPRAFRVDLHNDSGAE